jgi:hypothetical protein
LVAVIAFTIGAVFVRRHEAQLIAKAERELPKDYDPEAASSPADN